MISMHRALLLLSITAGSLSAEDLLSYKEASSKTQKDSCCLSEIEQVNLRCKIQPISASAAADCGVTVDGSLLYWNAKSEGYEFVQTLDRVLQINPVSGITAVARVQGEPLPFDSWDVGSQVGLGYIFSQREQWSSRLGWTHFDTKNHLKLSVVDDTTGNLSLLPILVPLAIGSAADTATAQWHLHYNILDAELSRQFFVGKWLSLKPIIGLRGGWIRQFFKADYAAIFNNAITGIFRLPTSFQCYQNLGGVGVRIGSNIQWYMAKSWSLLGNLSTSLLWTSTHMKQRILGFTFPNSGIPIHNNVTGKYRFLRIKPNLEGQLGLQWETFYYQERFRAAVSTLYTFSYWFGLNRLTNEVVSRPNDNLNAGAVSLTNNGDLQLQGLNVKFDFEF